MKPRLEAYEQPSGNGKAAAVPFHHPDQSMFILANNKCDLSCCPSPYSCDKGCVCLTEEQKRLMAGRSGSCAATS